MSDGYKSLVLSDVGVWVESPDVYERLGLSYNDYAIKTAQSGIIEVDDKIPSHNHRGCQEAGSQGVAEFWIPVWSGFRCGVLPYWEEHILPERLVELSPGQISVCGINHAHAATYCGDGNFNEDIDCLKKSDGYILLKSFIGNQAYQNLILAISSNAPTIMFLKVNIYTRFKSFKKS